MSNFSLVTLPTFFTDKGYLTVLEKLIPFEIKRVYWIYGADDFTRGGHRHKISRQAFVALKGEIEIYINDGRHEQTISLCSPSQALIVEPEDWHTMKFSSEGILLVIASSHYSINDYIDAPY